MPESSSATAGMVWYDSQTRTLTLWQDAGRTDTDVVPRDTPEAVDAVLARRGWARHSGFAFAADSDTVRYAAVGAIPDPAPTGPASSATRPA
ncbi:hypothetical protein [Nocardia sp. alder85J]|uniref:hypothetical protein n=1 Tax=Nocardia sp. alder85J TaxID=2862949 RepID=UPI001CD254A1|nr:hypothetical protein [Nocardia sp. alder85J]MCX4094559.1 hypothetical protein [Nocardia sp. alder85J]